MQNKRENHLYWEINSLFSKVIMFFVYVFFSFVKKNFQSICLWALQIQAQIVSFNTADRNLRPSIDLWPFCLWLNHRLRDIILKTLINYVICTHKTLHKCHQRFTLFIPLPMWIDWNWPKWPQKTALAAVTQFYVYIIINDRSMN